MAKVKVSTKYALSDDDLAKCNKGKTWWCRNRTKGEFVKFPYTPANQTFDVELDLDDGEYQVSCGDFNAVNEAGRHCTQNIYFYVEGGKLHYVKRKDEFPSVTGGASSSDGESTQATFNPFGTTQAPQNEAPVAPVAKDEFKEVEGVLYCKKNYKVVTPDYTCVVDYMTDNTAVTGLDCCESCIFRQTLFVKKIDM